MENAVKFTKEKKLSPWTIMLSIKSCFIIMQIGKKINRYGFWNQHK